MKFCPNCNNIYNITGRSAKGVEVKTQKGGSRRKNKSDSKVEDDPDVTLMIKKILSAKKHDEEFNYAFIPLKITFGAIETNKKFQSLSEDKQKLVLKTVKKALNPSQKNMFKISREVKEDLKNDEDSSKAYYVCRYCKNMEPVKAGDIIFTQTYNSNPTSDDSGSILDSQNMLQHNAVPHTKAYVCVNAKCPTHKDESLKDAIMFRKTGYKITYVCSECKTVQ